MFSVPRLLSVAIIVLLYSPAVQAQTKQSYPRLLYNGRNYDVLITNRVPEYGISSRDGCVVMREMLLELRDTDAQTVEGLVKDVESGDALAGARIKLQRQKGSSEAFATDSLGRFRVIRGSPVKYIHVDYIGYRMLNIKGAGGKLF